MKKLLQINVEVNYGSTGRIAEQIGRLALAEGWESYIAFGRKSGKSRSRLLRIGGTIDRLWHVLQTRLFDRHGLASKRATRNLIHKIEKLRPSIVHLHNLHGYYLHYGLLASYLERAGIPVVWTLHDCWSMTGHCTHFEEIGCQKWKTRCHACPQLQMYPSSWGIDRSAKNHALKKKVFGRIPDLTVVPVSNWLQDITARSLLAGHPSEVIANGVDTVLFRPLPAEPLLQRFGIEKKFVVLGVASVWSTHKGLADFISLSRRLQGDELIVLIGLTKRQRASLPPNMIGLERTEHIEELAQWYSAADVYVNTSIEETFGLTTAEALACGTPIIVYDSTACPEMVRPDVGLIGPKGNIGALYRHITEIRKKGKEAYTNACRTRAVALYDKNKNYPRYIDLYRRLVGNVGRTKTGK